MERQEKGISSKLRRFREIEWRLYNSLRGAAMHHVGSPSSPSSRTRAGENEFINELSLYFDSINTRLYTEIHYTHLLAFLEEFRKHY